MRDLTSKQKKFLDKWYQEHKNELTIWNIMSVMSDEDYQTIEDMNDTEILYQNVNNYIADKI